MSPSRHSLSDIHKACVNDDPSVLEEVLSTSPHLFHLPLLMPVQSGVAGHPQKSLLDMVFENRAWRAAEVLLRCPGLCPEDRKWPQEKLGFLCERMSRQPLEKARHAIPLVATLTSMGARPLGLTPGLPNRPPLFVLLEWLGSSCLNQEEVAEKMGLFHEVMVHVDLAKKVPPLNGRLAHNFFYAVTGLGESTVIGPLGFNRFEGLLPAILDLLHARGWRDPEFLRWSTGMCPAVAAQWQADALGAVIPEGAPVPAQSRFRL